MVLVGPLAIDNTPDLSKDVAIVVQHRHRTHGAFDAPSALLTVAVGTAMGVWIDMVDRRTIADPHRCVEFKSQGTPRTPSTPAR